MSKNRGLGRGFDSLIPTELDVAVSPVVQSNDSVLQIEVGKISPNPQQPRTHFDESDLRDLADSIKKHGILQPLVVSDLGEGRYELIAGERRLRASKLAGLTKVPVIVRSFDQQQKLEMALIENIQRSNLNPIEAAIAYKKLGAEFNLTLDQIGERVGKAKSTVSNAMRLLQLPKEALEAVATGKISEAHGRAILATEDPSRQQELLGAIINQGLNVRQAEEFARQGRHQAQEHEGRSGRPANAPAHDNPLVDALSAYLHTRVQLQTKSSGGRIVIEYTDDDELKSIVDRIRS